MARHFSRADRLCLLLESGLALFAQPSARSVSSDPAEGLEDASMTQAEKKHTAGLMRVNYSGEVCAQALYLGQSVTTSDTQIAATLYHAAQEEEAHLTWCAYRLAECADHSSYLDPLWWAGSALLGVGAGALGLSWGLGFIEETEEQVTRHLQGHLGRLPKGAVRARATLKQMIVDEQVHATWARAAGATTLPAFIQGLMASVSTIMTKTSYRL
jgi:3-demethoxyubiquinol 3-hydroxylase